MVKTEWWIIVILILIILFSLRSCYNEQEKRQELVSVMHNLGDTLKVKKNKYNQQVAKIAVIETAKTKAFLQIKNQNEEIKNLQNLVKKQSKKLKKGGSASIINIETTLSGSAISTITKIDTVFYGDSIEIYPTYSFNLEKGKWASISGASGIDSTYLDLKINNEYSVVVGKEKKGLFKKPVPFVEVTNKNPYSSTKSLRTYQVSIPKPNRFGIGVSAGYGVGIGINGKFHNGFYVGVGVNYNLIEF